MKIFFTSIIILLTFTSISFSQNITEKELLTLGFKGNADSYSFVYDKKSDNYCYIYRIEEDNKSFIISKNTVSEKFDFASRDDIRFDSKGNYYTITSNYKPDYGIDNNFVVVNGKDKMNFDLIDSYSSYINSKDEFVFVFKQFDLYKIGYYSLDKGFRQSDSFDVIKPIFKSINEATYGEEESGVYSEEDFFHNDKGERGFIGLVNGKAKLIFESGVVETEFTDIDETSVMKNNNNELSYIAKSNGRFYESAGDEFVVSGNNQYNKFQRASHPLIFNSDNIPLYSGGDSISEFVYNYYLVIGNQKQDAYSDASKTQKAQDFGYGISNIKILDDGSVTYFGMQEVVIPTRDNPGEEVYDAHYSKSYFVKDGVINELGYNIGPVKFNKKGDMLYSGIADLSKKESLLMLNYGESKIIINKDGYGEIINYGFTPGNDIYYVGQNYENPETGSKSETFFIIGDKLIGKAQYVVYQNFGDSTYIFTFDSGDNYAIAAEEQIDSTTFSCFIITASGPLPFPKDVVSGSNMFSYISNLKFSKDDKLFFIGDMKGYPSDEEVKKEVFVNNKSLGKIYNSIDKLIYDESKNEITFIGSRGKKIYFVTVRF